MTRFRTISLKEDMPRGISNVILNRPERRNAFNAEMVSELLSCFTELAQGTPEDLRLVVLRGAGDFFSAGGDLEWMRGMAACSHAENLADAETLAKMLSAVYNCPVPLIGMVRGGAYGGALGLLCCCDTVICAADCSFAFSEARIGLAPATIAPFVLNRLNPAAAAHLLLSAQRFDAAHAVQAGLVHKVGTPDELEELLASQLSQYLTCGPLALRQTKSLLRELQLHPDRTETRQRTAELIASLRVSPEGQEGLSAFLEKRKPGWAE